MSTSSTVVVTFAADVAAECVRRFAAWVGSDVPLRDLGTLDGHRRVEVPKALWEQYTRDVTARTPNPSGRKLARLRCATCGLDAPRGPMRQHVKAHPDHGPLTAVPGA